MNPVSDYLINIYVLFTNIMNTAKQEHTTMDFLLFFEPCLLDDFHESKMSIGLYNGKNPVIQLSRDVTTYIWPMGHLCSKEQR